MNSNMSTSPTTKVSDDDDRVVQYESHIIEQQQHLHHDQNMGSGKSVKDSTNNDHHPIDPLNHSSSSNHPSQVTIMKKESSLSTSTSSKRDDIPDLLIEPGPIRIRSNYEGFVFNSEFMKEHVWKYGLTDVNLRVIRE